MSLIPYSPPPPLKLIIFTRETSDARRAASCFRTPHWRRALPHEPGILNLLHAASKLPVRSASARARARSEFIGRPVDMASSTGLRRSVYMQGLCETSYAEQSQRHCQSGVPKQTGWRPGHVGGVPTPSARQAEHT